MNWLWLLLIFMPAVSAKICPDGGECPGTETCCPLSSGAYGCCPYPSAVCCSDHEHCCPDGYTCSSDTCIRKENTTFSETPLMKNGNMCPNKQEHCPSEFTCCPSNQAGQFSCCPLPNGVCCDDNVHCCPSGATCNLSEEQCLLNGLSIPLIQKSESIPSLSSKELLVKTSPAKPVNTICPDPRYSCTGSDPCCRTPAGSWTCCMYPHGSCCSDGFHCCPYGMVCIQSSYCVKGNVTTPTKPSVFTKVSSQTDVICPDKSHCSDSETCCKTPGAYGCCPFPNAVCCSDELHCCPQGFTCDSHSRSCSDGVMNIPWLTKTPSF